MWLGGRPVMLVRGKFSNVWSRFADASGTCARNAETASCGTYLPVTDYLGKPVVMLQNAGGTAGTARYQPYGHVNRREARYASAHNATGTATVATLTENRPTGFDGPMRVLFHRANYTTATITFNGVTQALGGAPRAHVWSSWESSGAASWPLAYTGAVADYGFDTEAYEVRFKQTGVTWAWTPLRFPGQYYDDETELHENWNRNYDPATGRYLQPEPLLSRGSESLALAGAGYSMPAFSYALGSPLRFVDADGLQASSPAGSSSCGPPNQPPPEKKKDYDKCIAASSYGPKWTSYCSDNWGGLKFALCIANAVQSQEMRKGFCRARFID